MALEVDAAMSLSSEELPPTFEEISDSLTLPDAPPPEPMPREPDGDDGVCAAEQDAWDSQELCYRICGTYGHELERLAERLKSATLNYALVNVTIKAWLPFGLVVDTTGKVEVIVVGGQIDNKEVDLNDYLVGINGNGFATGVDISKALLSVAACELTGSIVLTFRVRQRQAPTCSCGAPMNRVVASAGEFMNFGSKVSWRGGLEELVQVNVFPNAGHNADVVAARLREIEASLRVVLQRWATLKWGEDDEYVLVNTALAAIEDRTEVKNRGLRYDAFSFPNFSTGKSKAAHPKTGRRTSTIAVVLAPFHTPVVIPDSKEWYGAGLPGWDMRLVMPFSFPPAVRMAMVRIFLQSQKSFENILFTIPWKSAVHRTILATTTEEVYWERLWECSGKDCDLRQVTYPNGDVRACGKGAGESKFRGHLRPGIQQDGEMDKVPHGFKRLHQALAVAPDAGEMHRVLRGTIFRPVKDSCTGLAIVMLKAQQGDKDYIRACKAVSTQCLECLPNLPRCDIGEWEDLAEGAEDESEGVAEGANDELPY